MLYIKNVIWLNPERLTAERGDLVVEEGPGGGMRLEKNGAWDGEGRTIEGRGMLATRAFACGHHHIYSALSRGMPSFPARDDSFAGMLENVWWRLDRQLDRDMIEASALAAAIHCARCGVTFVIDHHSSPFVVSGSLQTISRAFERVGVGSLLCCEISDRDGKKAAEQGLEETDAWLGAGNKGHVGLHASFTVSDALLKESVALARRHKTGVHIHVAESIEDQRHCLITYGKRVVERLADAGALEQPRSIFAHGIHLNEGERELLRQAPGWVVQNVESNLNNRVGLGFYDDLPRVMLGTDGMHGDMLRSMQAVWYAAPCAGQGMTRLTREGGRTEGEAMSPLIPYRRLRAVHDHIAAMSAPGDGANNIVLFDYDTPTPVTAENAACHLVFGLSSRNVHTVIAQGRVIVENHRVTSLDEDGALAFARVQAKRLWTRLGGRLGEQA